MRWQLCSIVVVLQFFVDVIAQEHAINQPLNSLSHDHCIRHWLVLGPLPSVPLAEPEIAGVSRDGFNRDFLQDIGGESSAVLQAVKKLPLKQQNQQRYNRSALGIMAGLMAPQLACTGASAMRALLSTATNPAGIIAMCLLTVVQNCG